jgi:hypothetical protein
MSEIAPVHRAIIVKKSNAEAESLIRARIRLLNGKVVNSDSKSIECDFGSLLKSRLFGEFFVSASTLPKKAVVTFEDGGDGQSKITLVVRDRHKYDLKLGYVKKYETALLQLSDSLLSVFG